MALLSVVSSGTLLLSKSPEDMVEIQANNFGAFAEKVLKPYELNKDRFFVNTCVFST